MIFFSTLVPAHAQEIAPLESSQSLIGTATEPSSSLNATSEAAGSSQIKKSDVVSTSQSTPGESSSKLNVKASPFEEIQGGNWGSSYFNLSVTEQTAIGRNTRPNIFMYQYVSLNYKMSRNNRLFFRPSFGYDTSGVDDRGKRVATLLKTEDFHMGWSTYNWFQEPIKVDTSMKVYLPTSASSRDKNVIFKFRPEVKATWYFKKYSFLQYMFKPDLYYTRNATYLDDKGRANATRQYELEHFVEATFDVNKSQSFKIKLGFEEEWQNGSGAESIKPFHKTDSVTAIGYEFRPFKKFNTTLYWSNVNEVVNTKFKAARRFGHPSDNEFVLLTNLSLF